MYCYAYTIYLLCIWKEEYLRVYERREEDSLLVVLVFSSILVVVSILLVLPVLNYYYSSIDDYIRDIFRTSWRTADKPKKNRIFCSRTLFCWLDENAVGRTDWKTFFYLEKESVLFIFCVLCSEIVGSPSFPRPLAGNTFFYLIY